MIETWQRTVGGFRAAFQTAPVGMALVSADPGSLGRFLEVNPAFCAMTGHSADHLLTLDFQALTHPDDVDVGVALAGRSAGCFRASS